MSEERHVCQTIKGFWSSCAEKVGRRLDFEETKATGPDEKKIKTTGHEEKGSETTVREETTGREEKKKGSETTGREKTTGREETTRREEKKGWRWFEKSDKAKEMLLERTIARGYIHGRGYGMTSNGENKHRHHYTDPEKQKEPLQTVYGKDRQDEWASTGTFTTFCGKTTHTAFSWEQPPWSSLCKKCDKKIEMEKRKIGQIRWERDAATEWETRL